MPPIKQADLMIAKIVRTVLAAFERLEDRILVWLSSDYEPDAPESCDHEWFVVSTATEHVDLILECYKCMSYGVVEDPTKSEWETAFDAPTNSYRWHDNSRVKIVGPVRTE